MPTIGVVDLQPIFDHHDAGDRLVLDVLSHRAHADGGFAFTRLGEGNYDQGTDGREENEIYEAIAEPALIRQNSQSSRRLYQSSLRPMTLPGREL